MTLFVTCGSAPIRESDRFWKQTELLFFFWKPRIDIVSCPDPKMVHCFALRASTKTPIIFHQNKGMPNARHPAFVLFVLFTVCILSPFTFADPLEEIKGQLRFGVRAAAEDHWDEAVYRWRKALQLDPNNIMAHNNLAVAYEQMGEYELALEEYEIAYRLDSRNEAVKSNLDRFRDFYRKYQRRKQ